MLKIFVLISYIVMIAVNYSAVAIPLAGKDTGAISDNYANLFAPAGYTFSIWGIIYILLLVYVIRQFFIKNNIVLDKINKIFVINGFLNAIWLFTWHYEIMWLSAVVMLCILYTLIKIANIVQKNNSQFKDLSLAKLVFGVYFGWITVATIANITILLVSLNWNRFGLSEVFWTVVILIIGAIIASLRTVYDKNIAYMLVVIWAYMGILTKHILSSGFAGKYPIIIYTAILCIIIFVIVIIYIARNLYKQNITLPQKP